MGALLMNYFWMWFRSDHLNCDLLLAESFNLHLANFAGKVRHKDFLELCVWVTWVLGQCWVFLECWAYNELAYWLAQFFQRGFPLLGLPEDNHDSPARIFLLIGFEPTVSWENETFPILGSSDLERMSWQKLSLGMGELGIFWISLTF